MQRDEKFFKKAESVAQLSEFKRARIGAVAVYQGKVISIGINSHKTHPQQMIYNRYRHFKKSGGCYAYLHSLHAEIDCLLSVDDEKIDMSKVEVYVYRITTHGMAMAKPCPACQQYMIDKGIRKVHYTTENSFVTEEYKDGCTAREYD